MERERGEDRKGERSIGETERKREAWGERQLELR